jgi:hypothetical protein
MYNSYSGYGVTRGSVEAFFGRGDLLGTNESYFIVCAVDD